MRNKSLLILNGSPRKQGTSYSFGSTIKQLAESNGHCADIHHIIEYYDRKKSFEDLYGIISKCDVVCLIAPLYVDTLPYPAIWFLEKLHEQFKDILVGKDFFAVSQNGFPDITLFGPILGSCEIFADAAGMNWLGGLAYGGGAIINGAKMEELGKKGQRITSGFKLALDHVFLGKPIPPKAQEILAVKIPKILYGPLAAYLNMMARKAGKAEGTDIERKAYFES